ncbi:DUF4175 family protein [Winogradskyella aurantia]|uniref:Glutamyl-tRNA synthetase n=1 Tax=Winogradskyella aurantia TaxID=1915063 RepID=A0A265UZU7_9FLAO|nr:DUF4175 family protein [Winogradskyella aurantia]OZV70843.1 hypothetical protein CA834_01635 [Winogradskyella aurantia]
MSNFETVKHKLEQFITKYYSNELLKGSILFFAAGLLYFFFTLFLEYMLWLSPTARTVLFWLFICVESTLFIKFIAVPLLQLFKLRNGINHEKASKLIGSHFPEVSDKLLNLLQLNQNQKQSDLVIASIEQKSLQLKPIPFTSAINFKSNVKYLKYAAIPVLIVLLSWFSGKTDWFSDGYERVVNYQTAYEPPAPFQFFVLNESLVGIEGKDFRLKVSVAGEVIPENVQIEFNSQTYYLQPLGEGEFQYVFNLPKSSIEFKLSANEVRSRPYTLKVLSTPNLVNFEMELNYPKHTGKRDEVLKSTGSAVVPEGTTVTWRALTKSTTRVNIYAEDSLAFTLSKANVFESSKRIFKNFEYTLTTSNESLTDYENLAFNIAVIKDVYPELKVEVQKDSLDEQSLYFYGQASDDYGLSRLQLVYYPTNNDSEKTIVPIAISTSNFGDFVSAFPDEFNLEKGVSYELYFEIFDNDVLHNYKKTKSPVFSYRKLTEDEEQQKQLQEQNETINDINSTFEKLQEQNETLEEFSKTQKEKEQLNFNDKKKFEEFLKRQKQQEQLMKNFNKKLQDNLEKFQNEKTEKDDFKEDLKERLKENEAQLKEDEKLLKELEEFKEKIDKEEFTQKLEELAKQNKNKKRSMKQLLELTKRFYVMKKAEKLASQLDELSEKQEELSKKDNENISSSQEKLNKAFKDIQKDIDELKQEDRRLQNPMDIPRDEFLESEINYDQNEAKKALEEKEAQNSKQQAQEELKKAQKRQKQAAKKIKKIGEMMEQMASGGGGGGNQMAEDIDMLRQILENLLLYSFDQEKLMSTFDRIDIDNNKYGKYIIEQSNLREHFEHIDDSLFALSLRQPKLSERVNTQITDVYFNIDKALGLLTENRLYQGVAAQQYAVTASNELASFLSDVLDNMEMSMNPSQGSGSGQGMQLPDIIKTQEEIKKELEKGIQKSEKGEEGQEGEKGNKEKGKDGKEGEGNQPENGSKQGQEGEQGQEGKQGGEKGQDGETGKDGNQEGNGKNEGENGENGKNGKSGTDGSDGPENKDGYGQGGNEEQNAELYKIYQKQQQLRQALEDKLVKEGNIQSAGQLIKQMEDIELDLLNYGFTNQTLQKMMDLQHQLLKMENATFLQGEDSKRQSKTNKDEFNAGQSSQIPTAKQYFNTTEILNRQVLPLKSHLKKKIQTYFKNKDD